MQKNAESFVAIGEKLYGPFWVGALADDLDVNERTIRRWAKGEYNIPDGIWGDLSALCLEASAELHDLGKQISAL